MLAEVPAVVLERLFQAEPLDRVRVGVRAGPQSRRSTADVDSALGDAGMEQVTFNLDPSRGGDAGDIGEGEQLIPAPAGRRSPGSLLILARGGLTRAPASGGMR